MAENPLQPIYDICNAGNSKRKFANLPEFPRMIDLELTNTCNFRCLMCPTGNFSQRREKGLMEPEIFYNILEQVKPYKTPIRFIRWGEPLSHPNVVEFVKACGDAGILTHINTNGSYLTEDMARALIEAGLSSLKFSFQGTDRKTYAEMRNTDFYDELLARMRMMKRLRGDRGLPFLHVSTSITYETEEQVAEFKRVMEELVDQVSIGHTLFDFIDINAVRLRPHELEQLKWLMSKDSLKEKYHPECPEIFDKLAINWDGSVSACCNDADNMMLVGDTRKDSLKKIWTNRTITEYRKILAGMGHDTLPLCKDCYDYQGIFSVPERDAAKVRAKTAPSEPSEKVNQG
jgi:MoaA/NifB/PqqE/SkfB family radical SAM enzyme